MTAPYSPENPFAPKPRAYRVDNPFAAFADVSGDSSTATAPHDQTIPGNIDLHARPVVKNPDGSISTVRSFSFEEDGKEILVPTISDDGKNLTEQQAVDAYHKTGKHLGIFPDVASADRYAQTLHEQQAAEYGGKRLSAAAMFGAPEAAAPVDPALLADVRQSAGQGVNEGPYSRAYGKVKRVGEQLVGNVGDYAAGTVGSVVGVGEMMAGVPGEVAAADRAAAMEPIERLTAKVADAPRGFVEKAARFVGPLPLVGGVKALASGLERRAAGAAAGEAESALMRQIDEAPGLTKAAPVVSEAELAAAEAKVPAPESSTPLIGPSDPESDFRAFVDRSVADNRMSGRHVIAPVTDRTAAAVGEIIGMDLRGAHHEILSSDVRHILNEHGDEVFERARGQVVVTPADIHRIPEVIAEPDGVELASPSPEGWPTVRYQKRMNGTVYYVEEALEPSKKSGGVAQLRGKTMWKRPARPGDAEPPPITPETVPQTPTPSTPENVAPGTAEGNTPPGSRETPRFNPDEFGGAQIQALGGIVGAGGGAAAGSKLDEKHPLRGALLGALAGGALGVAGGRALSRAEAEGPVSGALRNRRGAVTVRPEPASDTAIKSAIDQAIGDSRTPRAPGAPVNPDEFVNVPKFALDESGEQRLRSEVTRVVQKYGIAPKAVVSHEQTRAMAAQIGLGDLPKDQINTRLNGPQMLAIRNVVSQNVEAMTGLYKKMEGATPDVRATAEKALSHLERQNDALLSRFTRARTQTGRDLNNLKILANRSMDPFTWLTKTQNMLRQQGGDLTAEQTQRITELTQSGDRIGLVQYVGGLRRPSAGSQALSLWKTGLLTNPKTHLANVLGNTAMAGLETAKDLPAAIVDRVLSVGTGLRSKSFSVLGTAKASWKGAKAGIDEAGAIMRHGLSDRDLARWDLPQEATFKNPILRAYTQFITRSLKAEDAVFRKAALHRALAEAQRVQPGPVTEEMALQATADAEYATFQNNSALAQAGSGFRRPLGAAGHVIAPFTQTPGNVIMAAVDYSPFGAIRTGRDLYRLVKGTKAGASESELRALQKATSESAGRTATGTAPFLAGYILARKGMMTGARPEQKDERDQWDLEGKQENALHIGGKYYSLNRLSPLGNLMALGANYYALKQEPGTTPGGAVAAALGSIGTTATEQSFLSGVQDLTDAIKQPKQAAGRYATNLAGSVVPAIVGAGARATDRTMRDVQTPLDAIKSRVPGLSETLPAKVSALGSPKARTGSPLGEFFDPTTAKTESTDPVVKELRDAGVSLSELGQGRPNSATRAKWEKILPRATTPRQKAYVEGQLARATSGETRPGYLDRASSEGQQLHRTLAALIALPRYQSLAPEQRHDFLERAIDTVRRRQARIRKAHP